jgi:carboxypeptidase family protein
LKNKSYIAVCSLVAFCLSFTPLAFCSDLTGYVGGPSGALSGAQVTVTDASGKVVGQGTTDDSGRYCIRGIDPGTYKTAVNGGGLQPGASNSQIPNEGLTENWWLSSTAAASTSSNSPGVCGAAYLGSPWLWAGGALLAGGAIAACGLTCSSGGSGSHPTTPSK